MSQTFLRKQYDNYMTMSCVGVQIGQCGNQLGHVLVSSLADEITNTAADSQFLDYISYSREKYFSENSSGKLRSRSVLVDTEPKVIHQLFAASGKHPSWEYGEKQAVLGSKGSGNNWALGYCGYEKEANQTVMELIRSEVEQCDRLEGFYTINSLAGGTGSGLGVKIIQNLKDLYPKSNNLNVAVWPFASGEITTQCYNLVLSLAKLHHTVGGILLFRNDYFYRLCERECGLKHINLDNMNKLMAQHLLSLLMPSFSKHIISNFGDLLGQVACHPSFKLLTSHMHPIVSDLCRDYTTTTWNMILRDIITANKEYKQVGSLLIVRGTEASEVKESIFKVLKGSLNYPDWVPQDYRFKAFHQDIPLKRENRCATFLTNSNSVVNPLDSSVDSAWNLYNARAFLHKYLEQDLTDTDFVESFAIMESIIKSYKEL